MNTYTHSTAKRTIVSNLWHMAIVLALIAFIEWQSVQPAQAATPTSRRPLIATCRVCQDEILGEKQMEPSSWVAIELHLPEPLIRLSGPR